MRSDIVNMNKQSRVKSSRKALNPVFHLQTKKEDDGALSQGMIKAARKNGQLNLSGRGLACGKTLCRLNLGWWL